MHPSASIIARAEKQPSAPSAIARIMWKPVMIFPAAKRRTRSPKAGTHEGVVHQEPRLPGGHPERVRELERGRARPALAPVDGHEIGVIPVTVMAFTRESSSERRPTHSLNPTGFPPDSSRSRATK